MKNLLNIVLLASLVMLAGCVKEVEQDLSNVEDSMRYSVLTAGFADYQTKTYVEEGKYLRWHANDRITAFFGNTLNRQYEFEGEDGDNSGSFRYISSGVLETGNDIDRIYAVYPYDKSIKYIEGGKIQLSLPAVQNYEEKSFGKGANTMVAVTADVEDTFLPFKNVCGYLKLRLKGEVAVKSIEISGNTGEKISGKAMVTLVKGVAPELVMSEDATENVKLDCGDGVELSADDEKEFWFALPETTFENGISVVVETTTGTRYAKCTKNKIPIVRNQIQPMAALSVPNDFYAEGLNVIEYTATKQLKISGSEFNVTPISHSYDITTRKGVILFDQPVTKIQDNAFSCMNDLDETNTLLSVRFPASVNYIGTYAFHYCNNLSRIYLKSPTPPELGTDIFMGASAGECDIFVPAEAIDDYLSDQEPWASKTVWPYDYENDYPAIPDNEIWYTSTSYDVVATPESVTNWSVVENSFDNKTNKGIIRLSSSVSVLYDGAFGVYNGSNNDIRSLILPKKLHSIDNSCFYGWEDLEYVCIAADVNVTLNWTGNTGTYSYYHAFRNCPSLIEFVGACAAEDGRMMINGDRVVAFIGEYGTITEYCIPENIRYIGVSAFSDCSAIYKVRFPKNIVRIEHSAFYGCGLTEAILGDQLDEIEASAFAGCSSLSKVFVGAEISSIGSDAFKNCSSLKEFYCKALTPPSIPSGLFDSVAEDFVIYVPVGTSPAYKLDANWGAYRNVIKEKTM